MSIFDIPQFLDSSPSESPFFAEKPARSKQAGLANLSWLDEPSKISFGQRRQGEPPLDTVQAMKTQWENNLPRIEPMGARPETSPDIETPKNSMSFEQALKVASRRLHFGEPLGPVLSDLESKIGKKRAALASPLLQLDEGLVGRVYIRLSAFPGGLAKWGKVLRRRCPQARYLIDKSQRSLRKSEASVRVSRVVTQVPWAEAYRHYAAGLRAQGASLPEISLNPQQDLRKAFLQISAPKPKASGIYVFARKQQPAATKTATAAMKQSGKVPDMRLRRQVVALADKGIISDRDSARILACNELDPTMIGKQVKAAVAARYGATAYAGDGVRYTRALAVSRPQIKPKAVEAKPKSRTAAVVEKAAAKPSQYAGAIYRSVALQNSSPDVAPVATRVDRIASRYKLSSVQVNAYLQWARTHIAKGLAGQALRAATEAMWPQTLIQACEPIVREVRAVHEGKAGVQYVYADAHVSAIGVKGCGREAKRLRTVEGKKPTVVLASSKCENCVHRANLPGKPSTCMVYGLPVVRSV